MTNADKYLKDGIDVGDFWNDFIDYIDEHSLGFNANNFETFLNDNVKPTLTEDEKVILRNTNKDYEFIGRDDRSYLYMRVFPDNGNFGDRVTGIDFIFPNLFQFINRGEEYSIKELLGDDE